MRTVPAIHPTDEEMPEEMPAEGPQHPMEVPCPVHPTNGFVCIVREQPPKISKGGILLPEVEAAERAQQEQMQELMRPMLPGVVVEVGGGIENIATPCSVGDRVLTAGPAYSTHEGVYFIYELVAFSAVTAVVDAVE